MAKTLKNIAVIALTFLFLIVSSGFYINFHHCDITGDTEVMWDIPESENCCSSHQEDDNCDCETRDGCNHNHNSSGTPEENKKMPANGEYFKNFHCCSDSLFYLSIPDNYLKNTVCNLQDEIFEITFFPAIYQIIFQTIIESSQNHFLTSIPPPLFNSGKDIVYLNRQLIL